MFIGKGCWDYDESDLEEKHCSRCSSNLFKVEVSKGLACRHPGRMYLNVGYEKYTFDTEYKFSNFLCNVGGEPTGEPHPYSYGGKKYYMVSNIISNHEVNKETMMKKDELYDAYDFVYSEVWETEWCLSIHLSCTAPYWLYVTCFQNFSFFFKKRFKCQKYQITGRNSRKWNLTPRNIYKRRTLR